MKTFTIEEYDNAKYKDKLTMKCDICEAVFLRSKSQIFIMDIHNPKYHVCSRACMSKSKIKKQQRACIQCGNLTYNDRFCSQRCSGTYNSRDRVYKRNETKYIKCIQCGLLFKINLHDRNDQICASCRPQKHKICKICGLGKCLRPDICGKKQIIPALVKYFGFDTSRIGTIDVYKEFDKIKTFLMEEYWDKRISLVELQKKYKHENAGNFFKILKVLDIDFRTVSQGMSLAYLEGRANLTTNPDANLKYKHGNHTTWDGRSVYYRSSYEHEYAQQLDEKKILYDMECIRILYWDSQLLRERVAIPDFYIPNTNTIVEIKSKYTLDIQNMKDKRDSYIKHGYGFILVLEKNVVDLDNLM